MKKVLIGLTVFIGITAIFAFIFRGQIGMIAMMAFMAPSLTFEEDERPKLSLIHISEPTRPY